MAKWEREWIDWVKALLAAIVVAFIVRMFIFSPIVVDGPSMLPTLHDRDQMIVNKLLYQINEPNRFDIVVFHATDQKDFIKRIIGLPEEHISFKNNVLYVDGQEVPESFFAREESSNSSLLTSDFRLEELPGEYKKIPDGYVLVLGDNRNNSTDSRRLGLIPIDNIVGKASLIYWPFSRIQIINK